MRNKLRNTKSLGVSSTAVVSIVSRCVLAQKSLVETFSMINAMTFGIGFTQRSKCQRTPREPFPYECIITEAVQSNKSFAIHRLVAFHFRYHMRVIPDEIHESALIIHKTRFSSIGISGEQCSYDVE